MFGMIGLGAQALASAATSLAGPLLQEGLSKVSPAFMKKTTTEEPVHDIFSEDEFSSQDDLEGWSNSPSEQESNDKQ